MARQSNRVAIVTDSACDLPPDLAEELGVEMAPVHVIVDQIHDYRDHIDITTEQFYEILLEGKHTLSTAGVNVLDFVAAFERGFTHGDAVLGVILQPSYSVTFQNARAAAGDDLFEDRIIELEPGNVLARQGLVVVAAAEAARLGADMEALRQLVRSLRTRTFMVFLTGGTDYLRRGGRLGGDDRRSDDTVPVMRAADKFELVERAPTREAGRARLLALMESDLRGSGWDGQAPLRVVVDEAAARPEEVEALTDALKARFPLERLYRWRVGPTAAAHLGPGTLGIAYQVAPRVV